MVGYGTDAKTLPGSAPAEVLDSAHSPPNPQLRAAGTQCSCPSDDGPTVIQVVRATGVTMVLAIRRNRLDAENDLLPNVGAAVHDDDGTDSRGDDPYTWIVPPADGWWQGTVAVKWSHGGYADGDDWDVEISVAWAQRDTEDVVINGAYIDGTPGG